MAIFHRGCCCHVSICVLTLAVITLILSTISLVVNIAGGTALFTFSASYNGYDVASYLAAYSTATAVFSGLQVASSICLIIAVVKKVKLLCIPYMVFNVVQILANFAFIIIIGLFVGAAPILGGIIGIQVLIIILYVYCLLCVISHYQNLRDGIDDRAPVTVTTYQHPGGGTTVVQQTTTTGYGQPPQAYGQPPQAYGQPPQPYGVQQPYGVAAGEAEPPKY